MNCHYGFVDAAAIVDGLGEAVDLNSMYLDHVFQRNFLFFSA